MSVTSSSQVPVIMSGMILPEPHTMAIARTPQELRERSHFHEQNIDYRKIPRSSGDGMEHNGNGTESGNYPKNVIMDDRKNETFATSPYPKHNEKPVCRPCLTSDEQNSSVSPMRKKVHKVENDYKHFQEIHIRKDLPDISLVVHENEQELVATNLEANGAQSRMMFSDIDHSVPDNETFNTISDEYIDGMSSGGRRQAEHSYSEMQDIIKDLEERNSKLIEEKTKLCVQLGLQTQVNSDIKKLLVAAVGDDLDNSLEAILMKNAQSAVEIRHWKTLSEEYAEESDKLAIECDVWRTKFMASRMMSDELSSWRTTLYTKYKQTQNALQRILNERAELKKHLLTTKRTLQSLGCLMIKSNSSSYNSVEMLSEPHNTHQQSVLELASIISCLIHDLAVQIQDTFKSSSIQDEAIPFPVDVEKQTVEPSPAEKLAIQVLSSDVELHTEEQEEESSVMKRMGKQYIGNSYHSRLLTNSFRVTYDCCDRCKGPVQVV